ncbi:MAG: response regulator [Proteobacteria bacterium]|nr:response regulator [Pseudomonadota bacterium]
MKVLMAEDLQSVREHLGNLMADLTDVELRFMAQEAEPLRQAVAQWRPDVVILDLRMRGDITLAVLESIKKTWPGMAVVVSAFFFEPYYRKAFLDLGAELFFDKSVEWAELVEFLRKRRVQDGSTAAELAPVSSV